MSVDGSSDTLVYSAVIDGPGGVVVTDSSFLSRRPQGSCDVHALLSDLGGIKPFMILWLTACEDCRELG